MDAHETLSEKTNTEKRKETKHHSKTRSLENLQDSTGHKKTNTQGVTEPKMQRKANNLKTKTRMRMEYLFAIMDPNKKRKKQDTEDDEHQSKKSKKDTEDKEEQYNKTKKNTEDHEKQDRKRKGTEDHRNQDKKRKKDTKDHEKQDKKTKDREDHENQDKKNKGEARKERRKGWNMECCKRIKDCIKKRNKQNNEHYEEQAKKRSTEKRESQAKKRKGKSIEDHDSQAKKRKGQDNEDHDTQAKKKKMQDREQHDSQDKKRKRQAKEDHDTQAKKWKKQKKEEHETQANKRKREEKEPKKRRPLENYKRILDHLRKGRGRDSNNVLKLKVEAERVNKKRSVSEYCRVQFEKGIMTDATVRGHPCLVFFDTGASASIMFLSLAQRAGLLTGREKTEKILFSTWNGILLLDVIMLPEVLVVLKDGLAVNTPMLVFPKEAEVSSHNDVIVLSMSSLQEAEMRQDFHSDGSSTLFLRHPERLRRRPQPGCEGKVFAFAAQAPGIEEPLMVLLDTCSTIPFSITKIGRDKVRRRTGSETPLPTRVMLQLGSGTLTLQMNTNHGVSDFDFVFGRPLLCQLRAAIDYVDSTLTFKLNRKQFSLDIFPHCPHIFFFFFLGWGYYKSWRSGEVKIN